MPEAVSAGSRAAADPLRLVLEACHEPWAEGWASLDEALGTVNDPLREGLTRHAAAIEAAGFDATPPEEWAERSERLLEYRRAVTSTLLEPLAKSLQEAGPASRITGTFQEALKWANAAAQSLPAEVAAPWPEDALSPHPSDGLARRLGKVLARGLSAARRAGKSRPLPLRTVALAHLRDDVAEAQGEAVVEALAAWAAWGGRLERALIDWADSALPALVQAEVPEEDTALEIWAVVRDAAGTLQGRLEGLADEVPHAAPAAAAMRVLEACTGTLEADLAVAGSFLLRAGERAPAALGRVARVAPAYGAWDRDIGQRAQLFVSILHILAGATAVQQRVIQRCREGSLSNAEDLLGVASKLRGLIPPLRSPDIRSRAREAIAELDEHVSATLQPAFVAIPEESELVTVITEAADSAVEALLGVIRQAPASLVVHDRDATPPVARKVESRPVPLQELARQSFDALRIERIRASTGSLLNTIGGVIEDLGGLPEVFSFARDEALRELDSPEAGASDQAFELLEGALERMASSLETRVDDLDKALDAAHAKLAAEITDGSAALLGRAGAGRMQAQLLAARSRAVDLFARLAETWSPRLRRTVGRIRDEARRLGTWMAALMGRGRAFLGRESSSEIGVSRSLQSLAEVQALVEGLPLVYQRLFTLEPVTDPAMLHGRTAELESAMARFRRWHEDRGIPLVVRGRHRNGITSFLNVVRNRIEAEGHQCLAVTLDVRFTCESELASLLSKQLGLPIATSLDDVAQAIFAAEDRTLPGIVTLDNLEHVYLRVPKGTDLAERLLTLMAETEPRILWIGGVSSSAWQLIATAEPTAVSQLDVLDLPPLSAEAMRAAILARHRRSGLDVHYEESIKAGAKLRRRLRGMRDSRGFRQLLEDEFFDHLYRASGGSLGLALFLWLQSATFDEEEGVLLTLPQRPDFSILEQLGLTQNFTLKAFLEHRTLTLEEHDRIFRLPRHESYQIFESLRNRQLIEGAVAEAEGRSNRSEIEVDLRYRVRPLLISAIIAHLQGRNIVH